MATQQRGPDYNAKRRERYANDPDYRARVIRTSVVSKQRRRGTLGQRLISGEEYDELIRLRALLAALPEPCFCNPYQDSECAWCGEWAANGRIPHAPDCPYLAVQAELKEAP